MLLVLILIFGTQGTISFGIGFFFVVIGWPILGMILEAYGFIVLFRFEFHNIYGHMGFLWLAICFSFVQHYWLNTYCSGFWPTLAVFLQRIPILGWLFQQPYIRSVCSELLYLFANLFSCLFVCFLFLWKCQSLFLAHCIMVKFVHLYWGLRRKETFLGSGAVPMLK